LYSVLYALTYLSFFIYYITQISKFGHALKYFISYFQVLDLSSLRSLHF
jgi:hypothetical protein